jgi:hypothetical protein
VKYRDAVMPERQSDSLAFPAKSDAQSCVLVWGTIEFWLRKVAKISIKESEKN